MHPALIGNIGTPEILVILVIALLLFGRRLPEVGRSLGKGIVEFKKGIKGIEDDIRDDVDESDRDVERIPSRSSSHSVDLDGDRDPSKTSNESSGSKKEAGTS